MISLLFISKVRSVPPFQTYFLMARMKIISSLVHISSVLTYAFLVSTYVHFPSLRIPGRRS